MRFVTLWGRKTVHILGERPDETLCGRPYVRGSWVVYSPSREISISGDAPPRPKLVEVEALGATCQQCRTIQFRRARVGQA